MTVLEYFRFFSVSAASAMSHTAVQGSIGSRSAMGMHTYKVSQQLPVNEFITSLISLQFIPKDWKACQIM